MSSEEDSKQHIKISVLGKSLVGKSALTYRFISDKFPTEHDTTVEDQYKTFVNVDGFNCELEILDTAGQDDYQTMLDTWIDFGNCFLLVYAIDDDDSFQEAKIKYERITELKKGQKYSIILVGNKSDLPDSSRKVQKTDVDNYAVNVGILNIEASALEKYNVREAFIEVVHDYLLKNKKGSGRMFDCPCF